ncbi:MAG: hypothetical protein J0H62_12540 [Rhizobiales bacterium]|nr:hypothetical protein [Hyphomicrobiales bacterium]
MLRAATVLCLLVLIPATDVQAESCVTGSVGPQGATRSLGAQFRVARRVELIDWARGATSLSSADTRRLDDLRARIEEYRQAKAWEQAEAAAAEATKILGIVNKAESALSGC